MKIKRNRKIFLVVTMCICMFSSMVAFAATYSLNSPIIESYSTQTKTTMKITCTMTANPADYIRICITPYYSSRGSDDVYPDTTKYINSYTSRVENLSGFVSYVNNVDSHKTYTKIKQDGQKGINSSGYVYSTVVSKETIL